jgi:hypothetical protein
MFDTVFVCIFEFFKMQTEPGYLEKTGGYVQAGALKVPIMNVVKRLAESGNIAADLEARLTAYVDDRRILIHRWFQQNGRPADDDVEGFAPLIGLANRVEREAWDLARQLAEYMVKLAESGADADDYRNRTAEIFRRAHIE